MSKQVAWHETHTGGEILVKKNVRSSSIKSLDSGQQVLEALQTNPRVSWTSELLQVAQRVGSYPTECGHNTNRASARRSDLGFFQQGTSDLRANRIPAQPNRWASKNCAAVRP